MNTEQIYLSLTALKGRGWTDQLVKNHLGDPDKLAVNSHYKTGPPVRLYELTRVEAAEDAAEWIEAQARRASRCEGARKAAETKRAKLLAAVDAMVLSVPKIDTDELVQRACDAYNDYSSKRNLFDRGLATPASDPEFLARVSVNYLRHECSEYEESLADTFGKVGVRQAYEEVNHKIYTAIAEVYPDLAYECRRQLDSKFGVEA